MMILKNRRHGWWWGCAILITMWMPSGFAQSTTEMTPLETAAIDYEAALAELALPQEAWRNRYVDELAKLKTQVQAAGDLEQLLAIDRELASLESGAKSDILPKNKALYRLRSFYDKRTAQLAQVRVTGAREATLTYRKKLMAMQAAFTKTGKIDAALEVRAVLSGLTVPKVGQTAPTQGRPLAGEGNRRPGRLVIGGELYGGDTATIPEDMMDKPYVRVFAGQDLWYALTADGTVIHHDKGVVIENFPKDMKKPIVDVACGRYNYYGMHPDGSFTHWGLAKRMDKIPEGLTRVKGLAAGYSATIAWSPDGRAMIFGYTIDKYAAGKFAGPESFLQNVRTAAIGSDKVFVVKNDGTVEIADVKSGAVAQLCAEWTEG